MTRSPFIPYSGHNKLSALLIGPNFSLVDQAARVLADLIDFSVPEGYEDETGFHYATAQSKGENLAPADKPGR